MADQERPNINPATSPTGPGRSSEHRGTRESDVRQPGMPSGEGHTDMQDKAGDMAAEAGRRVQEQAGELRDRAAEMAPRAQEAAYNAAESGREGAASTLERAADNLDRQASGDGMTSMAAGAAADTMQQAAGYLRSHETAEVWDDVERYVRQHPGRSVLMAVAAGLVVGRVLR